MGQLTKEDKEAIRDIYREEGISKSMLTDMFEVSRKKINRVLRGR